MVFDIQLTLTEHRLSGLVIGLLLLFALGWMFCCWVYKRPRWRWPPLFSKPWSDRLFSTLWVPSLLSGGMVVIGVLWQYSVKMELPEVLAAIAIVFALVSLIDIRTVHFHATKALKAQKELKDEVVGRLGADYVEEAVSLYGQGKDVIISVTRNWGYELSEDLQNKISDSLNKALKKTPTMKIVFSGPIKCGTDFPKIMWRWKLLSDLKEEYHNDNIKIINHPELDVVFTVVDGAMLIGWSFQDNLYGQKIESDQTAGFFQAISERMLDMHCPVLSQWRRIIESTEPCRGPLFIPSCPVRSQITKPTKTCLPLFIEKGEPAIARLISGCKDEPLTIEAVLKHLIDGPRNKAIEDQFKFEENVRQFLKKIGATFKRQGSLEVIVLPPLAPASAR